MANFGFYTLQVLIIVVRVATVSEKWKSKEANVSKYILFAWSTLLVASVKLAVKLAMSALFSRRVMLEKMTPSGATLVKWNHILKWFI